MANLLQKIDEGAAKKGKAVETLWQFTKFIVVSVGAFVIQTFLPLLINVIIKAIDADFLVREFNIWGIFGSNEGIDPETGAKIAATFGLGLFISANISNIIAQIVSFFINRDKTFNSDANIAITLPIYIVFTIGLIIFSAWLSTVFIPLFERWVSTGAATSISGALCGAIQFFIFFPFDKLLFSKKKGEPRKSKKEVKEDTK